MRRINKSVRKTQLSSAAMAAAATIALSVVALAPVRAATLTYQAPTTAANQGAGGPKQFNLDHHDAYTWRLDNLVLPTGQSITDATFSIAAIQNWDTNPNTLFLHLLDTAKYAGVASFHDADSNAAGVVDVIQDNFAGALYQSNPLVSAATANTFLSAPSFSTTAQNYVFTFNATQIAALNTYVRNGNNIALGLDPDCHFWNNGMTLKLTTGPTAPGGAIPEPGTLVLLGSGLLPLAGAVRQIRRRSR